MWHRRLRTKITRIAVVQQRENKKKKQNKEFVKKAKVNKPSGDSCDQYESNTKITSKPTSVASPNIVIEDDKKSQKTETNGSFTPFSFDITVHVTPSDTTHQTSAGSPSLTSDQSSPQKPITLEKHFHTVDQNNEIKISETVDNEDDKMKILVEVINHAGQAAKGVNNSESQTVQSDNTMAEEDGCPGRDLTTSQNNKDLTDINSDHGRTLAAPEYPVGPPINEPPEHGSPKLNKAIRRRKKKTIKKKNVLKSRQVIGLTDSVDNAAENEKEEEKCENLNVSPILPCMPQSRNSSRWSSSETLLFYRALTVMGTDFSKMKNLFPNKSEHQLKIKVKKERQMSAMSVFKILRRGHKFNYFRLLRMCRMRRAMNKKQRSHQNIEAHSRGAHKKVEKTPLKCHIPFDKIDLSILPKIIHKNKFVPTLMSGGIKHRPATEANLDATWLVTDSRTPLDTNSHKQNRNDTNDEQDQTQSNIASNYRNILHSESLQALSENALEGLNLRSLNVFTYNKQSNNEKITQAYISRNGRTSVAVIPREVFQSIVEYLWNNDPDSPPPELPQDIAEDGELSTTGILNLSP